MSTVQAVGELSFDIAPGESVALLGHNGSGKSTTLKLLARTIAPTSGHISTRGSIAPLLELGSGFHPDLTGRENIFLNGAILGVSRRMIRQRFDEIVDLAGLEEEIDNPIRSYSSGMLARLGFSIATNVEPEIILVDEVLAVGDAEFQAKSFQRMEAMKKEGRTIVLVSHSFDQAESFCDRAIVLSHGALTFDGCIANAKLAFDLSTRHQ